MKKVWIVLPRHAGSVFPTSEAANDSKAQVGSEESRQDFGPLTRFTDY